MLYRLMRALGRVAVWIYFRRLHIAGRDNIPASGPVILAGNHPNSLVDPLVIVTLCRRPVRTMAKSTLFSNPVLAWFFRRAGAIPVHRAQDNPLDMSKNISAFEEAYSVLERGEVLGIFPEGTSHGDLAVRRLKTGVARIALEAEARRGFGLGVTIVPVGLNFEERAVFRSELFVNVGRPIGVARHRESWEREPLLAVRDLVEEVQRSLERLVLTVRSVDLERLVLRLAEIYSDDLRSLAAGRDWYVDDASAPSIDLALRKRLAEAVEWYRRADPAVVLDLQGRIDAYFEKLDAMRLTDSLLARARGAGALAGRSLPLFALGVAGLPLALFGALNNFVPYRLARYAGRRAQRASDATIVSTTHIVAGAVLFPLFYAAQTWIVWSRYGGRVAAVYVAAASLGGIFAYEWSRRMRRWREEVRVSLRWLTSRGQIARLRRERATLIRHLDALRDRYLRDVPAARA